MSLKKLSTKTTSTTTIGPKKDGGPNVDYFQSSECLSQFDVIRVWLQENCKKHVQTDPPTKEGLAQLVIQFIKFQQNKLGGSASDRPLLRLPMKVFMDMTPGGSLCIVLAIMFSFKSEQQWSKFNFQNPARTELHMQMTMEIELSLVSAEYIRSPFVLVRSDVDEVTANVVKDIIIQHRGEICDDEEEATHIIYPTLDPLVEDVGARGEYLRPVFRRGNSVMVHWYYLPDSYDTWAPIDLPVEVPDTINWNCHRSEPWCVTASWVLDMPQYGEWMNEEDYEVDANGKQKVHELRVSVGDLHPAADPSSKGKRKRSTTRPLQKHSKMRRQIPTVRRENDTDEEYNTPRNSTDTTLESERSFGSAAAASNLEPRTSTRASEAPANNSKAQDSATDDSDMESGIDDGFEDFRALRTTTRLIRDVEVAEDKCEDSEETGLERVDEQGDERMVRMNERLEEPDSDMHNIDDFSWSDDFTTFSGQEENYLRTREFFATEDPVKAFMAVWNEEIMNLIVKETNDYAWNKILAYGQAGLAIPAPLGGWTETNIEEMYVYFGVLILMSLCHRSALSSYWSTGIMGMPGFRRLMSRNRYLLITRFLHFVDNNHHDRTLSSSERKIYKIKPILDHCNARFTALYTPRKHLSLDESLLLWKGRLSWVQCIRTKAARFGIKSFELCEAASGYMLRCILYTGKNSTTHSESIHGFKNCRAKVVLELMDGFLDVGHTLVMDNWYNQLSLTRFLKRRGTDVIGTMNRLSVHVPNAIKDANPKHMNRGEQIALHCGDFSLLSWKDCKLVTVMSTYHSAEHAPATRAGVPLTKPKAIIAYNKHMGGVDMKDQQLSMFLMERKRGCKLYMKVFKRLLNTSLLNTFIIFKENQASQNKISHRQFRLAVAQGLLKQFLKVESVSRPNISEPVPWLPRRLLVGEKHFAGQTERKEARRRQIKCARCAANGTRTMVTILCTYCDVGLCPGRCWAEYHTLVKL